MSEPAFNDRPLRLCQCTVDWVLGPDRWRCIVWDKRIERTYEFTVFEARTEQDAATLAMSKFQIPEPSRLLVP